MVNFCMQLILWPLLNVKSSNAKNLDFTWIEVICPTAQKTQEEFYLFGQNFSKWFIYK